MHLKRRILDALDNAHAFPLPPAMVEAEFASIWAQVEAELKREGKTAADEGKTEDELKAEYRAIAERRVRLGLVLGKLGEQNGITITGDEVQPRHHDPRPPVPRPGTAGVPDITPTIRRPRRRSARPLFEDKVVDFIAELAQVTDKQVDRETLFNDPGRPAGKSIKKA